MPKTSACLAYDKDIPPAHQLVKLFWVLGPGFTRWAEGHMNQEGLTPQRVRLMIFLMENGASKMSNLRDEMGVTATNITALVDALEKDGMVRRKPHPNDRRATLIELTAKGEKRMTENCLKFKDRVSQLFTVFSDAEQERLVKLLWRMREALVEKQILKE
jgi:DNA-binding MarR family transcriptional regulator